MRALQAGRIKAEDPAVKHLDLCLGCRACEVACPSGVEYGALLEPTRDYIERHHKRSPAQLFLRRFLIERIFPFPNRMKLAMAPGLLVRSLGLGKFMPRFIKEALELLPANPSAAKMPALSPALGKRKGRVAFIEGCVMQVTFGCTNSASVRLLNAAGWDVVTPQGQGCCGALYSHNGNLAEAKECARRNIAAFEAEKVDAIIINAAGCGSTLKEYHHLLHDEPAWIERALGFSKSVKDLTEFLTTDNDLKFRPTTEKVTYHDACHLAHAQRITAAPRSLAARVPGVTLIPLPEADVCCGSAGSYNLTEPEMAEALQNRKVANLLKTEATLVLTSNPGCLLQMQAGLKKAGSPMRAMHLADFLADHLEIPQN